MKKILLVATAIAMFAAVTPSVQAQTPPAGNSAPGLPQAAPNFPSKAAPATDAPATMAAPARKRAKRVSMQQRFDAANTTHDGHLTRAQATAANWGYVTKHFDVMDSTKKGYVTVADIHAFGSATRAARMQKKAVTPASSSAPMSAPPAPAVTPAPSPATPAPK